MAVTKRVILPTKTPPSVGIGGGGNLSTAGSKTVAPKITPGGASGLPSSGGGVTPIPGLTPASTSPFASLSFLGNLGRNTWWQRIGVTILGISIIWIAILLILANNKKLQGIVVNGAKSAISSTPGGVAANLATGAIT